MKMNCTLVAIVLVLLNYAAISQKTLSVKDLNSQLHSNKSPVISPQSDDKWYDAAISNIEKLQYGFKEMSQGVYASVNPNNALRADITSNGYSLKRLKDVKNATLWHAQFTLIGINRNIETWPAEKSNAENKETGLYYSNSNFVVEYLNDKSGLRQNFIINKKLPGQGEFSINIKLGTKNRLEMQDKQSLVFYNSEGKIELVYDDLKAWDANGKILPAYMQLHENHVLSLMVNDADATYPITVDPLNHSPEWSTSADGLLPALLNTDDNKKGALLGYTVAGLGDVNGDGYDDVGIGAPGTIDILSGNSLINMGAVFVYYGSSTGLPNTPSKVLRSTATFAGALFGYSFAGGNVAGDSRNDIIVGAPGERYTVTVGTGILGGTTNVDVNVGKVYIFPGEQLANASPVSQQLILDGAAYFHNAVNVTIKALFGFSVAVTEDIDGDGKGEIIVGAPGYKDITLLAPTAGAAFVFYSQNFAIGVTKIIPPFNLLGGLVGNPLFGFSVDGSGNFNNDGNPTIVVGCPSPQVDLPGLLAGCAYVYSSSGGKFIGTSSKKLAAGSLLSLNIADLFGFNVKGVKDASGKRNGNILIGAPLGGLIPNLLALKLKAGNVYVFKKNNVNPIQKLTAPRTSNIIEMLQNLNLDFSLLFGISIDNMLDVNCDGINDIIIGEPLSTNVNLSGGNILTGTATVFLGKADGTYETIPYWSAGPDPTSKLNVASLIGFSVAGAGHIRGPLKGVRALIGAPGDALNFGSGLLDLKNSLPTIFNIAAGNNGPGKAYLFGFDNCGYLYNPDINATFINVTAIGNVNTNDIVPSSTTYGTPKASISNPAIATIVMNANGTYTFSAPIAGLYSYKVPLCFTGSPAFCDSSDLDITVLNPATALIQPVINTDIAMTPKDSSVTIHSLANDKCSNVGCVLMPNQLTITKPPKNGSGVVNPANGDIVYTPNPGFLGNDTLTYRICDNNSLCGNAKQIITVVDTSFISAATFAADDYYYGNKGLQIIGNVSPNDMDPLKRTQSVTIQNVTVAGNNLILNQDGSFTFTPAVGFSGPINFPYTTCVNGSICAKATLYFLIASAQTLAVNVVNFNYEKKDCAVQLTWKATSEADLDNYTIENSADGYNWKSIASVPVKSFAISNDYKYIHSNPIQGNNYYRLSIKSVKSEIKYSKVLTVKVDCYKSAMIINPSPFNDYIKIEIQSQIAGKAQIRILDETGKLILSQEKSVQIGNNQFVLDRLSQLSAGVYIIKVTTSERTLIQKVIK